jgi:outer membrane protein
MRNGLIIWNIILTVVAGYLLFTTFKKGKTESKPAKIAARDSASLQPAAGPFRIAYFEMDSIAAHFEAVKELRTEMTKKEESINAELDKLGRHLQERYNYYQSQAQAGSLSQTQSESASRELKNLDEEMKTRKQALDQEYNDFVLRRQNEIKTKIENFLSEYNKDKGYTYIISYEQGLFYYKDPSYDITADVVKGLNDEYGNTKK